VYAEAFGEGVAKVRGGWGQITGAKPHKNNR
jgi:hypothetical protein